MGALTLTSITKSFGDSPILKDVSLSIGEGEFLSIVGPSGCGKSTLMRIIAGLESQDSGVVRINERTVDGCEPKARDIAMVFQSYALYPHLTVRQNIALPLIMRDLNRAQRLPLAAVFSATVREKRAHIRNGVRQAADLVQLESLLDRKPGQLSGGQRQRVALARALVRRPQVFLLDEPLSNLDANLRAQTRMEIVDLQRRLGITTVYVTHDQVEAMTMSTRIAVLMGGQILQLGTPREIYEMPSDLRVAQFMGMPGINVLPISRAGRERFHIGSQVLAAECEGPDDRRRIATAAIRPEDVSLSDPTAGNAEARVKLVEYLGQEGLVYLDLPAMPGHVVVARVEASSVDQLAIGSTIGIRFPEAKLHFFDESGRRITTTNRLGETRISSPCRLTEAVVGGTR